MFLFVSVSSSAKWETRPTSQSHKRQNVSLVEAERTDWFAFIYLFIQSNLFIQIYLFILEQGLVL